MIEGTQNQQKSNRIITPNQPATSPRLRKCEPPADIGFWRAADVSQRLCEAIETLARLPMPRNGVPAGFRSSWPQIPQTEDGYISAREQEQALRSLPTAAAITRMEQCLPDWLLLIEDIMERKALYLRCTYSRSRNGLLSTRTVSRIIGISHQTVKNWEEKNLEKIAFELNRSLNLKTEFSRS